MSIAEFKRIKELESQIAAILKRLDELETKRKPGRPRKADESTQKEAGGSAGAH